MGCLDNTLRNRGEDIPPDSAPEFGGQLLPTGFRTQAFEPLLHAPLKLECIASSGAGVAKIKNIVDIERTYEIDGIL
jgi:hypothetical protein